MERVITETIIEHPMESVLDITPGTTVTVREEFVPAELVIHDEYDNKDSEIEQQYENIYTAAMQEFETQAGAAELVEGKYKARNAEVAVQFLNAALSAVNGKSALKQHKDKLTVAQRSASTAKTVNNNLVVANRNEILRMLRGNKEE